MIQFLGLTKVYKAKPKPIVALGDVSFEISDGEFVFLVGHSGSGKSTILKLLIREELPSSGKIYFDDMDVTKLTRNGIYKLRRQIGTIFQDFKLIDEKNAYENIAFAMEAAGMPDKEIKDTVPYVLDIVNLSDRAEAFPSELSGGEKQRVAIARAIVNNPKVLIADEPTGNLDPDSAWDVVQVLDKINKWGTTIIMSTHGTDIVNSLQKRVLKLEKGKLVRDDKKGGYSEADEFALKVLEKVGEDEQTTVVQAENPLSETKPTEKIKLVSKDKSGKSAATKAANSDKKAELSPAEKVKAETNKKNTAVPEVTPKEEKKLDELIHKADTSELAVLKLSKKLEDKLVKSGYTDVEDILSAGIGKVNTDLNQTEIRELAKAIKKFVTTE